MRNLVNGKEYDSSDGEAIEVRNPANNQLIATVPASTEEDVDFCVKSAVEAQKYWAEVPLYERGKILERFANLVDRDAETLAITLCRETGKTIKEARAEVANTRTFVSAYVPGQRKGKPGHYAFPGRICQALRNLSWGQRLCCAAVRPDPGHRRRGFYPG